MNITLVYYLITLVIIIVVVFLFLKIFILKSKKTSTTTALTTTALTTSSPLINSSLSFSNASQALITKSNFNILDLTSINTFTVEAWFFQKSTFSTKSITICADTTVGFTYYWSLSFNFSTNNVNFVWMAKDGKVYNIYHDGSQSSPNTLIPLNTWCHIALSVNNGNVILFINGNKLNLDSNSAPSFTKTSSTFTALTIANLVNDSTSRFNLQGNLTNLRINKYKSPLFI